MNDKKSTSQLVDQLIDSVTDIETVNTTPFFKDRVLSRLVQKKENNKTLVYPIWFGPQLQWAVLLVFMLLNLGVLYYYANSNQEQELQSFAQTYGLSSSQDDSILN